MAGTLLSSIFYSGTEESLSRGPEVTSVHGLCTPIDLLTHAKAGPKIKGWHPSPSSIPWDSGKLLLVFNIPGKKQTN